MAAPHPQALEQRLAALVPRVRALRVARGASACVLVAVAATLLVLLLDAATGLPATARGLFIAVWVTALGVLVWQLVVRPWQAEIPLSEVAHELAQRLPELADRLHTIVSYENDTSDAVRAALIEDALRRTKTADLARAIPAHPAMLRACGAILTLLGFLMLTGLVPGSADRLRRIALPWVRPPAAAVRVVVTSGEPVVKRGDPVTLTAFAERIDSRATPPAPETALALVRSAPGEPEQQLAMTADDTGVFHVTRANVSEDFEYRVHIGGAASEWLRVTALDPVELAGGTRFDLRPPEYAKRPTRELAQLADFEATEFTKFGAQLKFTRPAAAAHFEWRAGRDAKPELFPVELAPDKRAGGAALVLRASGELRLVLLREVDGKKLRTTATANVRVTPDKAPWFEQVTGAGPRPRAVRPGERVPITVVACDDMSVASVVLEFSLDSFDSRTETVAIPLGDRSMLRATGKLDFDPTHCARGEGRIKFRVRVTDNRTTEEPKLGPQEAVYPPSGWSELTFSVTALPLDEQDVLNERDAFRDGADAARLLIRTAADLIAAVRAEAPWRGPLEVHQTVQLGDARQKVRRARAALVELARDTALAPEMRPLAVAVQEIADRELRAAEDAINRAEGDETGRADALAGASKNLDEAGTQLAAVLARNVARARARLDRVRLGRLADDQAALAAGNGLGASAFADRQREMLARLRALVADSDALRLAAESANGEEARRLARHIAELSEAVRELDTASVRTVAGARTALVAEIARDQEELSKRAGRLFPALDTASRLAGIRAPKPEDFRRVTDLAVVGKTVEALTELEKQAQALDRLATEFETWAADRADPKKGAKQLALWQDDLLARFRAATKGVEPNRLPVAVRGAFRAEQDAIRAALTALYLLPDTAIGTARESAALHCDKARECLTNDGRDADTAMRLAAEALGRLADRTPPVGERLTKAARDFDKFRPDLDSLANAVEQALRGPDGQPALTPATAKRLGLLVERQRKLGIAVAALDLPGLTGRQARAVNAIALAAADLQDGSSFDVQASQLLVRREFERLKLALEGTPPLDVKAEELSRKLGALADALDQHGPNLTAKLLEPVAPVIQDALIPLPTAAPEAAVPLNDARVALQTAEAGFRDGSKPDEVRRRVRSAADAMGKLSTRLNGGESDFERVQRFASARRLAAVRAKELADTKAPFNAPASDEAVRQLNREFDELAHTRVGLVGQSNKKRVLELYNRLRSKAEPDRLASDQRALAEALDELAAKMVDIAELATVAAPESAPTAEADTYLPSRALAEQLRGLGQQQRALHDRLVGFPRALADRVRPSAANPFTVLEARQRVISADLLALAPEAEPAARAARSAADQLRTGAAAGAKEAAETAANLTRALARLGEKKSWGVRAAELAVRQSARLDDIAKLAGVSNAATAQQVARAVELAGRAVALADILEHAAKARAPQDPTRTALAGAVAPLRNAAQRLIESGQKADAADPESATRLRSGSADAFRTAHARASEAAPTTPVTNYALGDALGTAERAMRATLDAPPTDRTGAKAAADALRAAADGIVIPK